MKQPGSPIHAKLSALQPADVVFDRALGVAARGGKFGKRCITKPDDHQAILLDRLGLQLPSHLRMFEFEIE